MSAFIMMGVGSFLLGVAITSWFYRMVVNAYCSAYAKLKLRVIQLEQSQVEIDQMITKLGLKRR